MARIEGAIMINRPVEEVFDFVADERNEPLQPGHGSCRDAFARAGRPWQPLPR
jgi:hypothetical protein